jgi:alpha-tubulin suppressor-like RCC1 family protein
MRRSRFALITLIAILFSPTWAYSGSLLGWGTNDFGQIDVPAGNNFVAVAAGNGHSLALRSNGTLAGWGLDTNGQATVPGGTFTAIAAGTSHSLAIKSDGSILAWGLNDAGQTNVPSGDDYIAIAAGAKHSIALKSDGTMVGWGSNTFTYYDGGADDFITVNSGQATPPSNNNNIIAIAAASNYSMALRADGTAISWGRDEGDFILGNDENNVGTPSSPSVVASDAVAIGAGPDSQYAIMSDGSITPKGWMQGLTGAPTTNDFSILESGAPYELLALRNDGSLFAWGFYAESGLGPDPALPAGNNFVAIAQGIGLAFSYNLAIQAVPEPGAIRIALCLTLMCLPGTRASRVC